MTSQEINDAISEICDLNEYTWACPPLAGTGKCVPYIGWYWRTVDFDAPITLGDCSTFVGFMENNKWGYDEWTCSPEQSAQIRRQAEEIAANRNDSGKLFELLPTFANFLQTCRPVSRVGGDE